MAELFAPAVLPSPGRIHLDALADLTEREREREVLRTPAAGRSEGVAPSVRSRTGSGTTPSVGIGSVRPGTPRKGRLMLRLTSVLAVLASIFLMASSAQAKPSERARPHGQSLPAWTADWWTWVLSQPLATNPVLDDTGEDCAVAQEGHVWFLAGTFGGAVTRECVVPAGKTLFFPVVNEVYCAFESDPDAEKEDAFLRAKVAHIEKGAANLSVTVDGRPQRALRYVESDVFFVVLPADNVFGLPAGTEVGPCVDAGYYAFVHPLSVGEHTIEIQGTSPGIAVDVRYELTVAPRRPNQARTRG
jgi:hypothetical protein